MRTEANAAATKNTAAGKEKPERAVRRFEHEMTMTTIPQFNDDALERFRVKLAVCTHGVGKVNKTASTTSPEDRWFQTVGRATKSGNRTTCF